MNIKAKIIVIGVLFLVRPAYADNASELLGWKPIPVRNDMRIYVVQAGTVLINSPQLLKAAAKVESEGTVTGKIAEQWAKLLNMKSNDQLFFRSFDGSIYGQLALSQIKNFQFTRNEGGGVSDVGIKIGV